MSGYSSRSVSYASTCWMRSDHCWSHGRGKPEGLVPGRELDGAGASAAAERDRQRLEHDALHVVLGLGLGEPERVDLHAVAEPALLGVLHAVALAPDPVPERGHGAQLGVLLDEAYAGVDEEADAGEHAAHEVLVDALAHGVEHGDRVGHRVGDLLHRRGPGLLQVVGADVDRVPLRHVLHRVGDHVRDQPHGRAGRERVGAAGQVLLEDVVLRRALERFFVDALLLGHDDVERQQPGGGGVDRHRRVHHVERDVVRAGSPCRRGGRWARRPCPPRPWRARGRRRSRSASAGRTRSTGPSGPWPGCRGRARWTVSRWSGPRRSASSTDDRARAGAAPCREVYLAAFWRS